jgi:flagellar biosynthesis protein FlhG
MINDQLTTVRKMVKKKDSTNYQILAFTSGKGGVGKTNMALNVALSLVQMGQRVLIIDSNSNSANVDLLLGVTPTYTLQDVLYGKKNIEEVIFSHTSGLDVLPNGSGDGDFDDKKGHLIHLLTDNLWTFRNNYEYVIFDTAASFSAQSVEFMICADTVVVFTTPEPTAIADTYALIKMLIQKKPDVLVQLVLNIVESEREAKDVMERFTLVVDHFLNRKMEYLGFVVGDWNVVKAVKEQKPFVEAFPESRATYCVKNIAQVLISKTNGENDGATT